MAVIAFYYVLLLLFMYMIYLSPWNLGSLETFSRFQLYHDEKSIDLEFRQSHFQFLALSLSDRLCDFRLSI